jgi:pSer/pThr/pTyr-binding forkhead associated (FHA) protein
MWKLTIEDDEGQRTTLELTQEEYTIGRGADAAVRLTERNVSRVHAVLRRIADVWHVEDRQSYNGTFVNGARVSAQLKLGANDIIQLGDYRLEIASVADTALVAPAEPTARRPDRLVLVIGPTPGAEFPLEGERLAIGRAEDAHISINHASVSRLHCELVNLGQGRWEIVDQGSSNGIRINGVELRRGIIEAGDALELGDVRLRFIAAGKFFRPAVDISQQIPMAFDSITPAGASASVTVTAGRNAGKVAAIVAVAIGGLALVGYVMFSSGGNGAGTTASSAAPAATTEAAAQEQVRQALAVVDQDPDRAKWLVSGIPDGSSVRDGDEYRRLMDRWADAMFKKAEEIADPGKKRALLEQISDTAAVSGDKRNRATDLIDKLPRVVDLDEPARTTPRAPPAPAPGSETAPATAPPPGSAAPSVAVAPKPPPPPPPSAEPKGTARLDPEAVKRHLQGKMAAGTASLDDLRALKGACQMTGDTVCVRAAHGALQRKLKEKPP